MTSTFAFRGESELEVILKFGGGLHTRASEEEIDPREAKDGTNAQLDPDNRELRNRDPFDLVGTTPNGAEIRGFATLQKADGTTHFLVQASDKVYDWDGTTFTDKGTVSPTARLRGRREANWILDDKVLITDLALSQPVMEYDGTTLANVSFNLAGSFQAKYCYVAAERAVFANVISNNVATPHVMVGSQRDDFTILSVTDRPSSSLNPQDPFFLTTPDLKPINGMVQAFVSTDTTGQGQDQRLVLSSENGVLSKVNGSGADNFTISEFYPESGAAGDESLRFIGNDIIYGRQGRIESVTATDRYGDITTDDLSFFVADQIESFTNWTSVYNFRNQRAYMFPENQSELWVYFKELRDVRSQSGPLSPWMKWTTVHPLAFQPTAVLNMFDPVDGLEYTFMGDANGNIYRLEGTGTSGDGGTSNITMEWLSALFIAPKQTQINGVQGYIKYRANLANTVRIRLEYAGESAFNEEITIDLPAVDTQTGADHWNGDVFWNGDFFWNVPFARRLTRRKFGIAGQSNELQARITVEGTNEIEINEIGLFFEAGR